MRNWKVKRIFFFFLTIKDSYHFWSAVIRSCGLMLYIVSYNSVQNGSVYFICLYIHVCNVMTQKRYFNKPIKYTKR